MNVRTDVRGGGPAEKGSRPRGYRAAAAPRPPFSDVTGGHPGRRAAGSGDTGPPRPPDPPSHPNPPSTVAKGAWRLGG